MTQISNNSNIPITSNGYTQAVPQQSVATPQVNVTTPQGVTPIYQYPTTSLYEPNSKQATSGVNIYISNPTGYGMPGYPYNIPNVTAPNQPSQPNQVNVTPNGNETGAIPNTPISENTITSTTPKKNLVEINDEYVKSVESYLRSPDETIRLSGITELVKRFAEDESRYNHPALIALLNIALQDPSVHNRLQAMTPIAVEQAYGDENTMKILQNLSQSTELYGQEAKMANEAILKLTHTKTNA